MSKALGLAVFLMSGAATAQKVECSAYFSCQVEGPVGAQILKTIESQTNHEKVNVWLKVGTNDDVKALSKLPWLRSLQLGAAGVSDLSPLANLKHLRVLHVNSRKVTSVAALAGLVELERLSLHMSGVTDLSPLRNLTKLKDLALTDTVTDIAPLANLPQLEQLNLYGARAKDWSPLRKLVQLHRLDADETNLDPSVLPSLKKLGSLSVRSCELKTLNGFGGLVELGEINLGGNNALADLSPLAKLTKLRTVYLGETAVKDVSPLRASAAEGLRTLDLPKTANQASIDSLKKLNPDLEVSLSD